MERRSLSTTEAISLGLEPPSSTAMVQVTGEAVLSSLVPLYAEMEWRNKLYFQ